MAWLSGWSKRVKLTTNAADVDDALSDFPVLLYISTSSGYNAEDISFVFDELQSDANRTKIAVTTSDGTTQCYVEIEKWDDANEKAWLWVKAPAISATAGQVFYLYYDADHAANTDYVGDPESTPAKAVWDSNFKAVYHMKDKTTSTVEDSTSNENDGTKTAANRPNEVDGKVGKGQKTTQTGDLVTVGADASITDIWDGGGTVSFWVNLDSLLDLSGSTIAYLFSKGWYLYVTATQMNFLRPFSGTNGVWRIAVIDTEADVFVTVTYNNDATGNDATFYINGVAEELVAETTPIGTRTSDSAFDVVIFNRAAADRTIDGMMDEIRFSDIVRSAAWIKATYETSRDHLLDWGSEEEAHAATISCGLTAASTISRKRNRTHATSSGLTAASTINRDCGITRDTSSGLTAAVVVEKWSRPTSHDTETAWTDPANAYDGDTDTNATYYLTGPAWTPYIELYDTARSTNRVKLTSRYDTNYLTQISVDVRRESDSEWQNIYEGVLVEGSNQEGSIAIEYPIGSRLSITGVRVKYYNPEALPIYAGLYEAEILSIGRDVGYKRVASSALTVAASISRLAKWTRATSSGLTAAVSIVASGISHYLATIATSLTAAASVTRRFAVSRATASGLTAAATISKSFGKKITTSASLAVSATISRLGKWARSVLANLGVGVKVLHRPKAITQNPTNITASAARINGQISNDGGEACDVRFRWRAKNGAGEWGTPTSHDTDTDWTTPGNAYDGDTGTYASITTMPQSWSPYLELYFDAVHSTKVRTYVRIYDAGDEISIDVRRASDDVWVNIHEGVFTDREWEEHEIGETLSISGIRLKYFNNHGSLPIVAYWYEAEIWAAAVAWTTEPWDETGYSTNDTFYHDLTDLDAGTEYEYQAQAKNTAGEGDWSASKNFWTAFVVGVGLTTSASITRKVTWARGVSAGLTSAASIVASAIAQYLVTVATSLTAAVSLTRKLAISRASSSGLTAATSITKAWGRKITTSVGLTAGTTISRLWNRTITTDSSLTAAATISRLAKFTRATSSGLTAAVSVVASTVANYLATISAGLTVGVSVARKWAATRATNSALTAAVTIVRAWGRTITTSSALTVATTISKFRGWTVTTASNLQVGVSIVIETIEEFLVTVSVGLTAAASVAKAWGRTVTTSSALTVATSVARAWGRTIATASGLTAAVSINKHRGWTVVTSVGLVVATTISRLVAFTRSTTSGLVAAVSVIVSTIGNYTIQLAVGLTAAVSVSRTWAATRVTSSGLTVAAAINRIRGWTITTASGLTAAVSVAKSFGKHITTSVGLTAATSISRTVAWTRATASGLVASVRIVTDQINQYLATIAVGLTVAASVTKSWGRTIATSVGLTAATSITKAFNRTIVTAASLVVSTTISRLAAFTRATASGLTAAVSISRATTYLVTIAVSLKVMVSLMILPRIKSLIFRVVKAFTGRTVRDSSLAFRDIKDDHDQFRPVK